MAAAAFLLLLQAIMIAVSSPSQARAMPGLFALPVVVSLLQVLIHLSPFAAGQSSLYPRQSTCPCTAGAGALCWYSGPEVGVDTLTYVWDGSANGPRGVYWWNWCPFASSQGLPPADVACLSDQQCTSSLVVEPYCGVHSFDVVVGEDGSGSPSFPVYVGDNGNWPITEYNVWGYTNDRLTPLAKSWTYTDLQSGQQFPSNAYTGTPLPSFSAAGTHSYAVDFGCDFCPDLMNWPPPGAASSLFAAPGDAIVIHQRMVPTMAYIESACAAAALRCQVVSSLRSVYSVQSAVNANSKHQLGLAIDINPVYQGQLCNRDLCMKHAFCYVNTQDRVCSGQGLGASQNLTAMELAVLPIVQSLSASNAAGSVQYAPYWTTPAGVRQPDYDHIAAPFTVDVNAWLYRPYSASWQQNPIYGQVQSLCNDEPACTATVSRPLLSTSMCTGMHTVLSYVSVPLDPSWLTAVLTPARRRLLQTSSNGSQTLSYDYQLNVTALSDPLPAFALNWTMALVSALSAVSSELLEDEELLQFGTAAVDLSQLMLNGDVRAWAAAIANQTQRNSSSSGQWGNSSSPTVDFFDSDCWVSASAAQDGVDSTATDASSNSSSNATTVSACSALDGLYPVTLPVDLTTSPLSFSILVSLPVLMDPRLATVYSQLVASDHILLRPLQLLGVTIPPIMTWQTTRSVNQTFTGNGSVIVPQTVYGQSVLSNVSGLLSFPAITEPWSPVYLGNVNGSLPLVPAPPAPPAQPNATDSPLHSSSSSSTASSAATTGGDASSTDGTLWGYALSLVIGVAAAIACTVLLLVLCVCGCCCRHYHKRTTAEAAALEEPPLTASQRPPPYEEREAGGIELGAVKSTKAATIVGVF